MVKLKLHKKRSNAKMKEIFYYDLPPSQIRIVSKKLCLDHTFTVGAAEKCVEYEDILALMKSSLIDDLFICFGDGTVYVPNIEDGSLFPVLGWYPIRQNEVELRLINEYDYTIFHEKSKQNRKNDETKDTPAGNGH